MRKVLLKKPASMKSNPAFKGGKRDTKQKKIDAHLKHSAPESFSLKKLRKESYNWKERVQFYLSEGDWDKPYDKEKTRKLMQKRQITGGMVGGIIKKSQMKKRDKETGKRVSALENMEKKGWKVKNANTGFPKKGG
jgi:hypothetical protein